MIFVECTPDTTLARALSAGNTVVHVNGASTVCRKLQNIKHCKGMVDERDVVGKHPYVKALFNSKSILQLSTDLLVCEDKANTNKLILIQPRLEEWIINCAKAAKIQLTNYDLYDDPEQLHDQLTLGNNNYTLNKFRLFIQQLQSQSNRINDLAKLLK
jgi:hypothetical protein